MGSATGHEHHPIWGPATESLEVLEDFFGIEDRSYHKLQLVFASCDQGLDDMGGIATCIVSTNPCVVGVADGGRVTEFWADGPKVAFDLLERIGGVLVFPCWGDAHGSCGFDRQMLAAGADCGGEFPDFVEDHRFAAGEHDVSNTRSIDLLKDIFDALLGAFGFPGSVAGIAEPASQIAAARADKQAWGARKHSFALNTFKDFCDANQSRTPGR